MTDDSTSNEREHWLPLLSEATILNSLIAEIGFDTSMYELTDVLSLESCELAMIPQPVAAVIMLYPRTDAQLEHHGRENITRESDDVWFIKERIPNACATIASLHALMNLPVLLRTVAFRPDSWLHSFSHECPLSLSPVAKAERLEGDSRIKRLHNKAAQEDANQASSGSVAEKVITHYVAFVNVNGGLYELDGLKEGPVRHCDTKQETFLKDACEVVKKFMKRDPHEKRFNIFALASKNAAVPSSQVEHPHKRRKKG
jgi:ubiquitin carboxyl-terminal hydrolase L3